MTIKKSRSLFTIFKEKLREFKKEFISPLPKEKSKTIQRIIKRRWEVMDYETDEVVPVVKTIELVEVKSVGEDLLSIDKFVHNEMDFLFN